MRLAGHVARIRKKRNPYWWEIQKRPLGKQGCICIKEILEK
jgi:hypothetical protein